MQALNELVLNCMFISAHVLRTKAAGENFEILIGNPQFNSLDRVDTTF